MADVLISKVSRDDVAWQAALPNVDPAADATHAADPRLADLRRWWVSFDDPLLLSLIDAAQAASPSLSSAA